MEKKTVTVKGVQKVVEEPVVTKNKEIKAEIVQGQYIIRHSTIYTANQSAIEKRVQQLRRMVKGQEIEIQKATAALEELEEELLEYEKLLNIS